MTKDVGRSPASQGRAGALRAEPAAQSQAKPLVPNAVKAAKRLTKAQQHVLLSLLLEAPKLLNHRESVSTLAMERVQIGECVYAQLTRHAFARGRTIYDTTATGQLTTLGAKVQDYLKASAIEDESAVRNAETPNV